ncbi:MAG: tRNA threonylcarbamoyladenosine dehydratase [Sphingobacteriia bacterium]|nr:tRNA threonylcarbamoyladenosine dehydratase [Sphingobacteriia bacterium]
MNVTDWMGRTRLLLGEEELEKLKSAHVLVTGLGGVGGIAAEMIARAHVGKMTIVDGDIVETSNRNRQIPALFSTENKFKTEVMAQRLLDINPELELVVKTEYIKDEKINELFETHYDYVVDAIDTLSPKVYYLRKALEMGFPIISSMGAGGKTDPTCIKIADISESYNCNLAKDVRKYLHRFGIRTGIPVVFSAEMIDKNRLIKLDKASPKKSVIGTISYIPALFGCMCAGAAIRGLLGKSL